MLKFLRNYKVLNTTCRLGKTTLTCTLSHTQNDLFYLLLAREIYHIKHLPFNFSSVKLPINYHHPIYGSDSETFLDFVAPGIMCSIIFFLAVGLTSLTIVLERKVNPSCQICVFNSELGLVYYTHQQVY